VHEQEIKTLMSEELNDKKENWESIANSLIPE
jgi:hypothetical protein